MGQHVEGLCRSPCHRQARAVSLARTGAIARSSVHLLPPGTSRMGAASDQVVSTPLSRPAPADAPVEHLSLPAGRPCAR